MLERFRSAWVIDFEFLENEGCPPQPWCAVGYDLRSGEYRYWRFDRLGDPVVYDFGPNDLVIAYAAEAEGKCIRQLGWPLPVNVLDLLPLFRRLRNAFGKVPRASLLDALAHFGIAGMNSVKKGRWRDLARRGPPFTIEEMEGLVSYCQEDVDATAKLAPHLSPNSSDLPLALFMGRYTLRALASVQLSGIPVDQGLLMQIADNRELMAQRVVDAVNPEFDVYEGTSFRASRFVDYLVRQGIRWPASIAGRPLLDEDTFKEQCALHPQLEPLREVRKTLAALKRVNGAVGPDGRCRPSPMPFASKTGRNQPKMAGNIFAWPKWMRHLIQARDGKALIMLDYEQQEFLIAAALSGDARMLEAYRSGDPYLFAAKAVGKVPQDATKETHRRIRDQFKTVTLSAQYGVSHVGLTRRLGDAMLANALLQDHQTTFSVYHEWTKTIADRLQLQGLLRTGLDWRIHCPSSIHDLRATAVMNWPVQATGADILRVATIALVEHGIAVCATVHDALLIEVDLESVVTTTELASRLMRESSRVMLGGPECRVEAKTTLPGQPFCDEPDPPTMRLVKCVLAEVNA